MKRPNDSRDVVDCGAGKQHQQSAVLVGPIPIDLEEDPMALLATDEIVMNAYRLARQKFVCIGLNQDECVVRDWT